MNVFVLSTGRCGSTTFTKACQHIDNYTTGQESKIDRLGRERLIFTSNHIEVDNRLSWFLGGLDKIYGDSAFYVHLIRDAYSTAQSFENRFGGMSIIEGYSTNITTTKRKDIDVCLDYWFTVNDNIDLFLKDKTNCMRFELVNCRQRFKEFWGKIGAEGDLESALKEWDTRYNKGEEDDVSD